jgi:hypothetical protein
MSGTVPSFVTAAAQSPDPGVRNLAARRMEIVAEMQKIDHTLESVHTMKSSTATAMLSDIEKGIGAGSMPKDYFVSVVRDILVAVGHPLQPAALFQRFHALYPGFAAGGADMMRKRLHGMKDQFRRIDGEGFWPHDLPVPTLVQAE